MGKEKKTKETPVKAVAEVAEREASDSEMDYDESVKHVDAVAKPLAPKKLCKKLLKLVKKASKEKTAKRGVREVVKSIRKGVKGLVILSGDVSPIDVVTHLPVLCEENQVAYVFVPSKNQLGVASGTQRATTCILVPKCKLDGFEECNEQAQKLCALQK